MSEEVFHPRDGQIFNSPFSLPQPVAKFSDQSKLPTGILLRVSLFAQLLGKLVDIRS
jgi:hypothetical protein